MKDLGCGNVERRVRTDWESLGGAPTGNE